MFAFVAYIEIIKNFFMVSSIDIATYDIITHLHAFSCQFDNVNLNNITMTFVCTLSLKFVVVVNLIHVFHI